MSAKNISELFKSFSDFVNIPDLISAKLLGKISIAFAKKRHDLGLSQTQMANKLNITQPMVSKIESGEYNFTIENLSKLCYDLDFDLDIEIHDKNKPSQYKPAANWNTDEKSRNLLISEIGACA